MASTKENARKLEETGLTTTQILEALVEMEVAKASNLRHADVAKLLRSQLHQTYMDRA